MSKPCQWCNKLHNKTGIYCSMSCAGSGGKSKKITLFVEGKKFCKRCNQQKNIDDFGIYNRSKDGHQQYCKICNNEIKLESSHRIGTRKPMNESKKSGVWLGCYVAERVLYNTFNNVIRMPMGNPGYDFICGRGFKIDVKSSCYGTMSYTHNGSIYTYGKWDFRIKYNNIADYFLLLAFDDRTNLNPKHMWLVPSSIINSKLAISIIDTNKCLGKWKMYEKSTDKVIQCCNNMKNKEHHDENLV
jgi:hypothetical protein